jgi:phosphoribosylformylglycinamidine synthase subunit PurQ / glutaminase
MRAAIVTFPAPTATTTATRRSRTCSAVKRSSSGTARRRSGDCDLVVLPGGFSYGDYLRAGAIARFSPIMADVQRFAAAGGHVLGICNGFQVLCEAHMLPGALVRNRSLKFQGERVYVRVESNETAFTHRYESGQVLHMHIAHGQGNYVADEQTLQQLEAEGRVVFRYVTATGEVTDEANANGSMNNIAGIINEQGNVLGLMPHPERSVERLLGSTDGLPLFASLADRLAGAGRAS